MVHKQLSAKPDTHYGTSINYDKTHVLLQLGDEIDQVRVRLTASEVDQLITDLNFVKSKVFHC
jgi:hypothetical protein